MNYTYNTNLSSTTTTSGPTTAVLLVLIGIIIIFAIFYIACMWRIFRKAGQPGWAAIIPIYNYIIILKIVSRPLWWVILFLIPFVNIVIQLIIALDMAKAFGKSAVFGVFGLFLFSPIGYPMLAFGSAKYVGPAAGGTPKPTAPATPAAA